MTLKFFDVGWQDRVKFRAKFVRRHPRLKGQLFFNRMKAAINDHWPNRRIPGIDKQPPPQGGKGG